MKQGKIVNNLVLELHTPNFEKVKEFYPKLGFEIITNDPVGEELGYLVLRRKDDFGDTLLNFYGGDQRVYDHSYFKDFPKNTKRGYEVEITIPVSKIETFYKSILPNIKDNVVQELETKRWGKQDFRIMDPFGFYIRFTELIDWGQ